MLPANVLQIYQTHKALIDEAIEIADESTISFDMERLYKTKLEQSSAASASQQKIEISPKSISITKEEILSNTSIESLSKIGEYGESYGINILVENHGGLSSNAKLLLEVINTVNKIIMSEVKIV